MFFTQSVASLSWYDSLSIPSLATWASCLLLMLRVLLHWQKNRSRKGVPKDVARNGHGDSSTNQTRQSSSGQFSDEHAPHKLHTHVEIYGGYTIYSFMVARFIGCVLLSSLAAMSCMNAIQSNAEINLPENWLQYAMAFSFLYSSLLAGISLIYFPWSKICTRHNVTLLLIDFVVYAYRDIWPLATTSSSPVDAAEGNFLWAKIVVLSLTAVFIPLLIPRHYIPIDVNDPLSVPNPEQTASIFSLSVYSFLDPIIFMAASIPHLPFDKLPALADYDASKYLTTKAFPLLDTFYGAKRRHLFWGLMLFFRVEFTILAFLILGQVAFNFASPIAINRLLSYLETGGRDATVRPWFWIFCLFIGPFFRSILFQWYIFINTRTLVRTEGLLTQLVFEHSLRIRVKAEPSSETGVSPDGVTDNPNTQENTKKKLTMAKQTTNLVGKINNLVTTDLNNIVDSRDFLLMVLNVPVSFAMCIVFLSNVLGWSALIGLLTYFILLPVPAYISKKIRAIQISKMERTDARVQEVTEVMGVLRMIKLFGWERKISEQLEAKRDEELHWLWKRKMYNVANMVFSYYLIPNITMLVTYATYTLVMKQPLTASKIFSSMPVFSTMRNQIGRTIGILNLMIKGKVSLDRVNDFLLNTDLLDAFTEKESEQTIQDLQTPNKDKIGFYNAEFSWSDVLNGSLTPSSRFFRLRIEDELLFKPHCINLIIGPTGSGKTSMLMALLGEMHFLPSTPSSWFHLPREGGVAYAAQESWVQNDTIRNNILFGAPYDEVRYQKVLHQCALEHDLELFEAGDMTEVGERGLTLSGGQKARVTLARAVYSPADILLLDDVLAALDVHTSSWIVTECFKGDLLKGRTVLLVTHNVSLTKPIADFIVSIGADGRAQSHGNEFELEISREHIPELDHQADAEVTKESAEITTSPKGKEKKGQLVIAEEIAKGHIKWNVIKLFLVGLGEQHYVLIFGLYMLGTWIADGCTALQVWFLGVWGSQYEDHDPSEVNVPYYLAIFASILCTTIVTSALSSAFFMKRSMRASKTIYAQLTDSVLGTTLRWLDETPTSRIITRCTQDIRVIDEPLVSMLMTLVEGIETLFTRLSAVVLFTPVFLVPGVLVGLLGMFIGNVYLKAQLSVKREMSNAKSPLLAHFGAAIAGLPSLRAYGAQNAFKSESLKRIDHYTRIARTSYNLNRWIGVRVDILGASFTTALASYLVYGQSVNAGVIGFSLNMAVEFCNTILWWVRAWNEFEVQANSLERIHAYIDIEQEPKPTESGKPPAAWPTSGDLVVERLSARYSKVGPKVLSDLTFHIKSGERVGVVGRTGSGKSSLTLSLLRCIITEGTVLYDGIPVDAINLDALRSNVTIIPQMPELLSGSLRRNLDLFGQHDDAELNDALRLAGLFSLQADSEEGRLNLDSSISAGGANLSVGQRQIIALARAIVRGSKLLILDEATSAIDYAADAVIQKTLRHDLSRDVTVLTVAHRLQTIMDSDKIMVLDNGRLAEFGTPKELLAKESALKSLVDASEDREILYAMAEGKGQLEPSSSTLTG